MIQPTVTLPEVHLKEGPIAWHPFCGRYHARRADCGLVPGVYISKANNAVPCLRQPPKSMKIPKKSRARRS